MKLKKISIKKIIRITKNNNDKNENHIWYKNKISRDKIQRKFNSIKDLRGNKKIAVKKTRIKSNIKTKSKWIKMKKKLT
jgi:hypothetical protein